MVHANWTASACFVLSCAAGVLLWQIVVTILWPLHHDQSIEVLETAGNRGIEEIFGNPCAWNPTWDSSAGSTAIEFARTFSEAIPSIKARLKKQKVSADFRYALTAIIHFRCGDVPFDRTKTMQLPQQCFYDFVAKEIIRLGDGVKEVVIMLCTDHFDKNNDQHLPPLETRDRKCHEWAGVQLDWLHKRLRNTGVAVRRMPICIGDLQATYSAFSGSALLVSLGGSFSFLPGITKGKRFIQQSYDPSGCSFCKELHEHVHWTIPSKFCSVRHADVADYSTFTLT